MLEVLVVVDHLIFLEITNRFISLCFVNYFSHFAFSMISLRKKLKYRTMVAMGLCQPFC